MSHFHVWNKLKSIFLVALSVAILTCSIPFTSFRSHALATGAGYLGSLALSEYLALSSYFLSRGYSAPHIKGDINNILNPEYAIDYRANLARQAVDSYTNLLEATSIVYSNRLKKALSRAATTGKLTLDEETDAFIRSYMESLTVDSSLVVGQTKETFNPVPANTAFSFSWDFAYSNELNVTYGQTALISVDYDCLPVIKYNFNELLTSVTVYFLPLEKINSSTTAENGVHISFSNDVNTPYISSDPYSDLGYLSYTVFSFDNPNYKFTNFNFGSFLSAVGLTSAALTSVFRNFRLNGFYESSLDIVSDQVYDTTSTDVLSTSSEVNQSTGVVEPGTTIYLPDASVLEEILSDFSENLLSWTSAIKALGLSSVSDSATVQEKDDALDRVAYPDSTFKWITETTWGSQTISQTVTNELVDTQTQEGSIAEEIVDEYADNDPDYEDPDEEKNKGGIALLLATALLYLSLWDDPDTDPTSPDSGGIAGDPEDSDTVPWLQDTLRAIPVVAGLESSIFQSAGGSNGYGFIYTVGVSFVLFSVLIGAGHFFGSLGNHADIQAKQVESPNRPGSSGKQLARSGSHRHAHVDSIKYKYEHSDDSFSVGS